MAVTTPVWGIWAYVYVVPIAVASALIVGAPMLIVALKRGVDTVVSVGEPATSFYLGYEPLAILSGAISAAVFWLTQVQSTLSRAAVTLLVGVALVSGFLLACALIWSQGWVPTLHGAHK